MHHNSRRGFLALLGLGAVGPAAAKVADMLPAVSASPVAESVICGSSDYAITASNPLFQDNDLLWNGITIREYDEEVSREWQRKSVFGQFIKT